MLADKINSCVEDLSKKSWFNPWKDRISARKTVFRHFPYANEMFVDAILKEAENSWRKEQGLRRCR